MVAAIAEYHEGLRRNAPTECARCSEAHLFLTGPDLAAWPTVFLREAGPYENRVRVVPVHLRGDAGLVVTGETGRNRFRHWQGELVTYLLGRDGSRWRLVGCFIRDIANPE